MQAHPGYDALWSLQAACRGSSAMKRKKTNAFRAVGFSLSYIEENICRAQ